jgi:carbon starvation protein
MNAAIPGALALIAYILGYAFYARYLSKHVFALRPDVATPAHRLNDGVDYVPARKAVLFGHHYASIAGLAPMLGPAVAVLWGWLPAMLWVVFGTLLVGAVHDFGTMVVSARANGKSIGKVAEGIIGKRAKTLFHMIIFFLVALAMGVFVYVIAFLFSPPPDPTQTGIHFPQAVIPSFGLMGIALIMGWLGFKKGVSWKIMVPVGLVLVFGLVAVAQHGWLVSALGLDRVESAPDVKGWSRILLVYAFLASVLPVWFLLQPRDFLNSLLLYIALAGLYVGFFWMRPEFVAPAVRLAPEGAPGLFPFVFIIVACGAASGFHGLVSSGTTAKQLNKETDARPIGYGGMIGESLLGLIAVLATTAGILTADQWMVHYANWGSIQGLGPQIGVFIQGASNFLDAIGVPVAIGATFLSLVVVSYALTSLDSATRLLRYNVEEVADTFGLGVFKNRYLASLAAVGAIGFFAFYEIDGRPAGLALWSLFGTTNQLLAGLALFLVTLYLLQRGKPWYFTGIPMLFVLTATVTAMIENVGTFYADGEWPLFFVGGFLLVLAVWVIIEALLAIIRYYQEGRIVRPLDIAFPEDGQAVGEKKPEQVG